MNTKYLFAVCLLSSAACSKWGGRGTLRKLRRNSVYAVHFKMRRQTNVSSLLTLAAVPGCLSLMSTGSAVLGSRALPKTCGCLSVASLGLSPLIKLSLFRRHGLPGRGMQAPHLQERGHLCPRPSSLHMAGVTLRLGTQPSGTSPVLTEPKPSHTWGLQFPNVCAANKVTY